eukprot:GHVP01006507.1.p1 GENE.GHVP01006507.1~~GHVP01006507.1.p1  ORF type:complete len:193 (-),score=20.99 GHVP01006507.1:613-1191(-)
MRHLTLISFQESNEIEESKEKILEALKLLKKKRFDKFVKSCTYKGVEVFVCRTTNGFDAFAQLDKKSFLLFELDKEWVTSVMENSTSEDSKLYLSEPTEPTYPKTSFQHESFLPSVAIIVAGCALFAFERLSSIPILARTSTPNRHNSRRSSTPNNRPYSASNRPNSRSISTHNTRHDFKSKPVRKPRRYSL